MRSDEEKDFASTTAYIYGYYLMDKSGFFDCIDKAMACADAFIKKYPTNTNWEKTEPDWETTLYVFYNEYIKE